MQDQKTSVKPARLRWRAIKRRTGGIDREAIQWLFATCGVIASGLGVAQFIWPDGAAAIGGWWLLATVGVGVVGGLVLRVTKRTIRAVNSGRDWSIHVVPGSVLDHRPCVITTDRRRSTSARSAADRQVGRRGAGFGPTRRIHLRHGIRVLEARRGGGVRSAFGAQRQSER